MATEETPLVANEPSGIAGTGIIGVILRMMGPGQDVVPKFGITGIGFVIALIASSIFSSSNNLILATVILDAFVAVSLGFLMTTLRVASTNHSDLLKTDNFKRLHRIQINNAEWNPSIMLLKFLMVYFSEGPVGFLGTFSAVWTDIGTLLYFLGVTVFPYGWENDIDSLYGKKLPPFRFAGVLSRYLAMYLMVFVVGTKIF